MNISDKRKVFGYLIFIFSGLVVYFLLNGESLLDACFIAILAFPVLLIVMALFFLPVFFLEKRKQANIKNRSNENQSQPTHATGNAVYEACYDPFGAARWSAGVSPTDFTFTGMREDAGLGGILDYNARYVDPLTGRFLSPDSIVPDYANPQDLNRYSYVRNNPLRFSDPTGMFSEDEIMGYMGVEKWKDVLAQFEEGGQFAGAWGFLQVLREAELGYTVSWWNDIETLSDFGSSGGAPDISGFFYEDQGNLKFSGQFFGEHLGRQSDTSGWLLGWMSNGQTDTIYQLNRPNGGAHLIEGDRKYSNLIFHPEYIDKGNLAWDVAGLGLSVFGLNSTTKVAKAAGAVGSGMSGIGAVKGVTERDPLAVVLGLAGATPIPLLSVPASTASIIKDVSIGFIGP